MKLLIRLSLLILFFFPLSSFAEIPEQLKADFSPISGTIIMPIGDEYLVDLDAAVNLREGDILTLVAEGEKIIHPDTKEVLGTLELAKGYLQVTQVKSGYSYVKLLSSEVTPKKGDRIKRFEQIPSRFETTLPDNTLAEELKLALPQLHWLSAADKTEPELIFILEEDNLKITNAAGVELKTYQYSDGKLSAPLTGTYQPDNFQLGGTPQKDKSFLNQAVDNLSSTIGWNNKDKRLENPGIIQGSQLNDSFWLTVLDDNPIGIAVADFDGDGQQETAFAMEDHLQILRMTDKKMVPVATINFSRAIHLLRLDTADIDGNGTSELYVSANIGKKLSSQVVEYKEGRYQNTITSIPWFFRSVDLLQGDQRLIAQTLSESENPLAGQPFRVERSGDKLHKGIDLPLPANINLFSFTTLKGANNDLLYAYISAGDYLHVTTPQGAAIWESANHFGGTENRFFNTEDSNQERVQPIFIQQRLFTLPSGEILAAQNDGWRTFERFRKFNKSRVIALTWDGLGLREGWKTVDQEGYLADFTLGDADNDGQDEIVMVVKSKGDSLLQKRRSNVIIYELNP